MIACTVIETPLGSMLAASENEALTGLWFFEQKYFPKAADTWDHSPDLAIFNQLRKWLARYFEGNVDPLDLPLAPRGTPFQQEVWTLLREIPAGTTVTYGQLARRIADHRQLPSMSAQAVGSAVGHNPLTILIPCHRVVGTDGTLTGFAGGLPRKQALLVLEGALSPAPLQPLHSASNASGAGSACSDM